MTRSVKKTAVQVGGQGVLVGLAGLSLSDEEREWLRCPATAGCVLFSRNFQDRLQLDQLVAEIRAARASRLLILVDQEGGRVQRFREGFTQLPALGSLRGHSVSLNDDWRQRVALHARLMAHEVLAANIDMSLAPVADLDGGCEVIGDRALASEPAEVAELVALYISEMQASGMSACAKHFPGHGCVSGDSHIVRPVDSRPLAELEQGDLLPFQAAISRGVASVMMSHVVHDAVDSHPAGFSKHWIQDILRQQLGFGGVVMSDDLGMEGAAAIAATRDQVKAGFAAGCHLMLACQPEQSAAAVEAAAELNAKPDDLIQALAADQSAQAAAAWVPALREAFRQELARI